MENQQPLVCPTHKTHYIVAVLAGALVSGVVSYTCGYYQGFNTAKKLVTDSPMGAMFISPAEIMTISGTVTAVAGNSVTLHMQSTNPFDDQNLLDRTISVNSNTKIIKVIMPDPAEMQAQMDAFMKAAQAGDSSVVLPTPTEPKETIIELSSIKVGDVIIATAIENIKSAKSFDASELRVQ